jgi:hypothetical protein
MDRVGQGEAAGTICINISRIDLERLQLEMVHLQKKLNDLEAKQTQIPPEVAEIVDALKGLSDRFNSLIGERVRFVIGAVDVNSGQEEKIIEALHTDQVTLTVDEPTRGQILSVIDIIKRLSIENRGRAPKEDVIARAFEMKIGGRKLEEILSRLRRAEALAIEGDDLRLL